MPMTLRPELFSMQKSLLQKKHSANVENSVFFV